LYRTEKALHEINYSTEGFEWVNGDDRDHSVFIYLRKGKRKKDIVMTILNLTPQVLDYKIGVDEVKWKLIFNSDDLQYGGSGIEAIISNPEKKAFMNRKNSIMIKLPPLSGIMLKPQ